VISAQIFDIDYYLPSKTLLNNELSMLYAGWTQEKIARKIGIEQRSIAAENETALDMGVKAVKKLFDRNVCSPDEIDFLVFCTQSPDYFLPTSACIMQHQLNLPHHVGAFDFNLGCSGYIYGLSICKGLIETGAAKNVLLVTSETYSKYINKNDRSTRALFGDGATASLLRGVEIEENTNDNFEPMIGPFVFGTNGGGANMLIVPAGGRRLPQSPETAIETADTRGNIRSKDQLYMNGQGIFAFAIEEVPRLVNNLFAKASKTRDDVDCYIFHQANRYMLERLQELCKLNECKYFNDVRTVGNTVSSSVPIAMVQAAEQGLLCAGDTAMLIGFGVGLSWGGTFVRLPKSLVRT
jgi:3-oxoacyl-[acyl-carrier-protein] synthase-3